MWFYDVFPGPKVTQSLYTGLSCESSCSVYQLFTTLELLFVFPMSFFLDILGFSLWLFVCQAAWANFGLVFVFTNSLGLSALFFPWDIFLSGSSVLLDLFLILEIKRPHLFSLMCALGSYIPQRDTHWFSILAACIHSPTPSWQIYV